MQLVKNPEKYDVLVMENLYGDILSDLASGLVGGLGLTASANIGESGIAMYEAVHGSAPDIYGKNIANPVAMIWSGALMLQFLGEQAAHDAILRAIEQVLAKGPRTGDLGGTANTTEMGQAIAALI